MSNTKSLEFLNQIPNEASAENTNKIFLLINQDSVIEFTHEFPTRVAVLGEKPKKQECDKDSKRHFKERCRQNKLQNKLRRQNKHQNNHR